MTSHNLYQQVVDVTASYLGPAAERFISRQIQTHLGKRPEELEEEDLEKLTDWVKIAIAFLTEDEKIVKDYSESLIKLSKDGSNAAKER